MLVVHSNCDTSKGDAQSHSSRDFCFPRQVRQFLNEDIVKDLMTSASAQSELEREFQQLTEDRNQLRDIFKQPNPRVRGRGKGREAARLWL